MCLYSLISRFSLQLHQVQLHQVMGRSKSSATWLHSQERLRRFASILGLGACVIFVTRLSINHVSSPVTSDAANKGSSYFASLQLQAKHESNFFPPECKNNWALDQINASAKAEVELINGAWYDNLPLELEKAYNTASEMQNDMGPTTEPRGHSRFDVMMPAIQHACPSLKRVGSGGDGGKLICGLDQIPDSQERPCIVYSLGSNNQWDFEESIHENTHCRVFTFDCTVSSPTMPDKIKDRVEFHQICLGEGGELGGKDFKSMKEVMTMLNHQYVTLLKMDIEANEWTFFQNLLTEDDVVLPEQMSFEVHYQMPHMPSLTWMKRQKTAGELALLSNRLYEAGYRFVSREDNIYCPYCSEFTAVRFRCPVVPRGMKAKAAKAVASY